MHEAGATRYSSAPTADPVRAGARSKQLHAAVDRGAAVAGRSLTGDGRLAAIAAAALRDGLDAVGSPALLAEFHARHRGVSDTGLQLLVLPAAPGAQLADALSQAVFLRTADRPATHFGVALDGQQLALVLSRRTAELDPVSRTIEAGAPITLRGRVASATGPVHVETVDPEGRRHRMSIADASGLHVRVPTSAPGMYVVEVVTGVRGQQEVCARILVYADEPPPRQLAVRARTGAPQLVDTAAELRNLVNDSRRAAGLSPLSSLPSLTALAVRHTVSLRDRIFVGLRDATPQPAIDRVRAAGFGTGLVLDNSARGAGGVDLHAQFMADAGLRRNLLSPELTHVGIGVVTGVGDELIATAVFIRLTGWVDLAEGRTQLLERINAARRTRGAAALRADPDLSAVAQESALRFFEPPFPDEQATVALANRHLDRLAIAYKRVAAVMATADDIAEVSALEPALDVDATHVGIGLSQGDHPRAGARRLAAVLTIGHGR